MGLFSYFKENNQVPEVPPQDLGSIDEFNGSSIMVVYTPISNVTQQIMNKTITAPTMKGKYTTEKQRISPIGLCCLKTCVRISLKFQLNVLLIRSSIKIPYNLPRFPCFSHKEMLTLLSLIGVQFMEAFVCLGA